MVEFLIDNSGSSGLGLSVPGTPPAPVSAPATTELSFGERLFGTGTTGGKLPARLDNPLSKIGLLLQSVSAGFQGKPSPVAGLLKEAQAEETNRLRAAQFQLKAAKQLSELLEQVPFDKQEKFAKQFSDKFKLDSEISGALVSDPPIRQALMNIEAPLQPFMARIIGTPNTPAELEDAKERIKDPKTAETARRLFDFEVGQQVRPKLQTIAQIAQRAGFDPDGDNQLAFQEIVDFNTQFLQGTELALGESELFYLRGEAGQRDLADRGITVSETVAAAQEAGATAEAKLEAQRDRFTKPVLNERGQLVQTDTVTNEQHVIDQEQDDFGPIVFNEATGKFGQFNTKDGQFKPISAVTTTPGEAQKVAEREAGKVQAQREAPADNFLLSELGLPANSSNAEILDLGGTIPTDKQLASLKELKGSGLNAAELMFDILLQIQDNPKAVAETGSLARRISGFRVQAENMFELSGIREDPDLKHTAEDFRSIFDKVGIDNATLQSRVIDLAFASAAMRGQIGRGLSDRDVELFARVVGGNLSNPAAMAETVGSVLDRFESSFSNTFRSTVNIRPPQALSLRIELANDRGLEGIPDAIFATLPRRIQDELIEKAEGGG